MASKPPMDTVSLRDVLCGIFAEDITERINIRKALESHDPLVSEFAAWWLKHKDDPENKIDWVAE